MWVVLGGAGCNVSMDSTSRWDISSSLMLRAHADVSAQEGPHDQASIAYISTVGIFSVIVATANSEHYCRLIW